MIFLHLKYLMLMKQGYLVYISLQKFVLKEGKKTCGLLQVEKKEERILSLHVVLHLVILYHR